MGEVEPYSRLAGVYDELVVDPCFPVWADFLDALWRSDAVEVRTVLDVCCGTGLLAAELIPRGYAVVGIDASQPMLDRARARLGPGVDLRRATLPELPVDGIFDAGVCTFDGLNYLSPSDFRASLAAIAQCLRPGGWLVFDIHTDAMLALAAENPRIDGEEDGHAFSLANAVDPAARTVDTTIDFEDDQGAASETHRQYFHPDDEVRAALADAGLDVIGVADEYSSRPAGESTMRATWVCRVHV
ncbi:MAG: class I SAM-dependent methyltransferase [Actinomycetota bacterium]|nr:class I SAM-dependent methyltransferase [Actinomycetota bacterium]